MEYDCRKLENSYSKSVLVDLPRKPYMAILCIATEGAEGVTAFTRDSIFEEMKFTSGGRKFRVLKDSTTILFWYVNDDD